MALPKIQTPIFSITIPSTSVQKKFRPFLVKEEKILLLAQQGNELDQITALKQIINNCCLDDIVVDKLTTFDLEYVFLKLRAKSVNNIVKLKYRDFEDEQVYDFEVNLDEVEVRFDPEHEQNIKVTDEVGIIMKYPDVKIAAQLQTAESTEDMFTAIVINCIDSIYDSEKVYPAAETDPAEIVEFIDSLDHASFEKIQKFFETMPKLYHELNYTNKNGNERKIKLESVKDFFTLG